MDMDGAERVLRGWEGGKKAALSIYNFLDMECTLLEGGNDTGPMRYEQMNKLAK